MFPRCRVEQEEGSQGEESGTSLFYRGSVDVKAELSRSQAKVSKDDKRCIWIYYGVTSPMLENVTGYAQKNSNN